MSLYRWKGKLLLRDGKFAIDQKCCCGNPPSCCPGIWIPSSPTLQGTIFQVEITGLTGNLPGCFTLGATDTMRDNWPGIEQFNAWTTGDPTGHDPTTGFFGDVEWSGLELTCVEDVAILQWRDSSSGYDDGPCPMSADGGPLNTLWTLVSTQCDPFEFVFAATLAITDDLICTCPTSGASGNIQLTITIPP